jgi:hypothetical protein
MIWAIDLKLIDSLVNQASGPMIDVAVAGLVP